MPVSHQTTVFDVADMRVYPLLTDSSTSASPTYGTPGVQVPGVDKLQITPNYQSGELKGSGRVVARRSRIDRWQGQITYDKVDLDILSVIFGGTGVTENGTVSTEWAHTAATSGTPYFGAALAVDQVDVGVGSLQMYLYKCQSTGGGLLNQASDNFGQPTFNFDAISLDSTTHELMRTRILAANSALPTDLGTVL